MSFHAFLITLLTGSIAVVIATSALTFWINGRRFDRRNIAGIEEFSSYGQARLLWFAEGVAMLIARPVKWFAALMAIFLVWFIHLGSGLPLPPAHPTATTRARVDYGCSRHCATPTQSSFAADSNFSTERARAIVGWNVSSGRSWPRQVK